MLRALQKLGATTAIADEAIRQVVFVHIFSGKMSCPPKLTELLRLWEVGWEKTRRKIQWFSDTQKRAQTNALNKNHSFSLYKKILTNTTVDYV